MTSLTHPSGAEIDYRIALLVVVEDPLDVQLPPITTKLGNNSDAAVMTSLQKAAAAAENSNKSSFHTSHGQFETCFASGLDLTEFGSASTTGADGDACRESASAQLLRLKKEEKRRKQDDEDAEEKMRKVVQGRVANIQEAIKKKHESSNVLVNALVQMHGSDTSDASMYRKNKKLSKKLSPTRRHTPTVSAPSGKAHKKSRRSKY